MPDQVWELDETEWRREIRASMRCDKSLDPMDFQFLDDRPRHRAWLERNLEPRLWSKLDRLLAEWKQARVQAGAA